MWDNNSWQQEQFISQNSLVSLIGYQKIETRSLTVKCLRIKQKICKKSQIMQTSPESQRLTRKFTTKPLSVQLVYPARLHVNTSLIKNMLQNTWIATQYITRINLLGVSYQVLVVKSFAKCVVLAVLPRDIHEEMISTYLINMIG